MDVVLSRSVNLAGIQLPVKRKTDLWCSIAQNIRGGTKLIYERRIQSNLSSAYFVSKAGEVSSSEGVFHCTHLIDHTSQTPDITLKFNTLASLLLTLLFVIISIGNIEEFNSVIFGDQWK